ncbi:hypothetical protein BLS_008918 [Venturia inaequalis]|uniref:RING-type domain-containing protein n=1 Tax=Venturia inaequalis TaxID=5025 RepID=A0A8H3U5Z6_VENIN|nr:hypothetical protein BLS_008918 [Venturia inaequalis]KAE9989412.1 hypothetical protein EG327_002720 [Venturia inaequalis]
MAEVALSSKEAAELQLSRELSKTLSEDEVPVKLRCAVCNKLAVNAFRFICCEQNICEDCNSQLSEQCPICAHSPLSPAKPSKALRLTIKAFVKNIEKKREKERLHAISAEEAATPIAPPTPTVASTQAVADETPAQNESLTAGEVENAPANGMPSTEEELNVVESVEQPAEAADPAVEQDNVNAEKTEENDDDDAQSQASDETEIFTGEEQLTAEQQQALLAEQNGELEQDQTENGWSTMYNNQQNFGFDNSAANYQGMDYNAQQQMMMQQMMLNMQQNGGYSNMMGVPGMPMDMSAMFGGFGMQGMNPAMMNGMMMGMGMDSYNGGFGNSWNNGQQLNGDFGASGFYPGGGYNQSHQAIVPQTSQYQQYPRNNLHNQNRFQGSQRGRGGYYNQGRGQYDQSYPQPQAPPNAPTGPKAAQAPQYNADGSRPLPEGYGRRPSQASSTEPGPTISASGTTAAPSGDNLASSEGPSAETTGQEVTGNTDNILTQQEPGTAGETAGPDAVPEQSTELAVDNNEEYQGQQNGESGSMHGYNGSQDFTSGEQMNGGAEYGQQIEYNNNFDASSEYGMAQGQWQNTRGGGFRGRGRGGFRGGRGGWQQGDGREFPQPVVEPKGVGVEGAPTGPKALREGKPNTGWSGIARGGAAARGRGGFANATPAAPASSNGHGDNREEKSATSAPVKISPMLTDTRPTDERARSPSRAGSRSRSHSRSDSKSRRRAHRHRSVTPSESEYDRKKERRSHRSSRKHDDGNEARVDDHRDRTEHKGHDRSRDDSVDDKYRSSRRDNDRRRSHRDTSKDRRRHRHRSRSPSPSKNGDVDHEARASGSVNGHDADNDKKHYRDKYRDRSRDRDREKDRHREKDRDKERDKKRSRRDRSRSPGSDHEHRSSRRSRKEKDRERERDRSRQRDAPISARLSQPHTPMEPEAEFSIIGRSKDRVKPPPTGPASMQPPTGPRNAIGPKAQIKKSLSLVTNPPPTGPRGPASHSRKHSQPATPTSAVPTPTSAVDPYEEERKKAYAERLRKEQLRRGGPGAGLSKKRSFADANDADVSSAPTGPKGHRKRGSRDEGGGGRGKKSRRTSYKYEDEETAEQRASRVEMEREASRWK